MFMGLIRRAKLGLAVILVQLSPVLDQNLYYMGMKNLSATFTSAMLNMLPAFAFCLAWIFRFEKAMQSGVAYYVMGMVVKEKGPIFYLAFHPLATVGCNPGFLVLAEQLYIGSVIGVALIIIGLYLVLWGKAKDQSPPSQCCMIDEVALITQRLIDDQQR
ncbi:WAT1-related protein At2g39510 [Rosa chinensis]|uniref:WAT1-related protein At2g39510 n=1 Tax=Rosa chinensis TaxID=74649 RepID=UPI000D096444|nr:WAT1-related protein At2g39510 [Rosa chinensis]